MTVAAIKIAGLAKVFRVWRHPSDMLKEVVTGRRRHTEFQALTDVSLEVPRGAIVGIMGRNGAGKSTLLRIVAGTLDATAGTVAVNGRISAILELGTGFHSEYSGRENIALGGMCLGLSRQEIAEREEEIIDFAELRDFIDQPFRTYSSGMQARLTFAVATSVNPDIMIIDEALSVGDIRFQRKSYARLERFRKAGATVLFVSHDTQTTAQLSDRIVLLDGGRVVFDGDPGQAISLYTKMMFGEPETISQPDLVTATPPPTVEEISAPVTAETVAGAPNCIEIATAPSAPLCSAPALEAPSSDRQATRYGNRAVTIEGVWLEDEAGRKVAELRTGEGFTIAMQVQARSFVEDCSFGFRITTVEGKDLYGTNTMLRAVQVPALRAGTSTLVRFRNKGVLAPGWFFATVAAASPDDVIYDRHLDALHFQVRGKFTGYRSSIVDMAAEIELRHQY